MTDNWPDTRKAAALAAAGYARVVNPAHVERWRTRFLHRRRVDVTCGACATVTTYSDGPGGTHWVCPGCIALNKMRTAVDRAVDAWAHAPRRGPT